MATGIFTLRAISLFPFPISFHFILYLGPASCLVYWPGTCCVTTAGLKCSAVLLPQPPHYRFAPLYLASDIALRCRFGASLRSCSVDSWVSLVGEEVGKCVLSQLSSSRFFSIILVPGPGGGCCGCRTRAGLSAIPDLEPDLACGCPVKWPRHSCGADMHAPGQTWDLHGHCSILQGTHAGAQAMGHGHAWTQRTRRGVRGRLGSRNFVWLGPGR